MYIYKTLLRTLDFYFVLCTFYECTIDAGGEASVVDYVPCQLRFPSFNHPTSSGRGGFSIAGTVFSTFSSPTSYKILALVGRPSSLLLILHVTPGPRPGVRPRSPRCFAQASSTNFKICLLLLRLASSSELA